MKIIKLEFTEKEKDLILQKIDHSMYDIESINKDYIEYEIKSHGYHNLVPFVYKNYLLNHQSNIEVKENSTIKLYDKTLRPKLEIFKQLLHDKRLIELEIIEHACFFELKIVKILETCYKSQNPEKFISSLLFQYMHYFEKNVKIEVPNLQSFYVITLKEFKDAHDWSLNSYESSFLNTHVELGIPSYVLNRLDQLFNFSEKSIKIPSFYGIYGKDYYRMLIYYIQEKNLKRKDLYAKDVKLKDLKIDYLYSTFQNEKYTNDLIYLLKYLESLGFRYSSICNLTTKKYSTCLSLKRNINNLNYYCESFEILKDVLKEKNKDFCGV